MPAPPKDKPLIIEVLNQDPPARHTPAPGDIVGRRSDADLRLHDESVSRRHLKLDIHNNDWTATDLKSRHGTRVNGVELKPNTPHTLRDGDHIALGNIQLRVLLHSLSTVPGMLGHPPQPGGGGGGVNLSATISGIQTKGEAALSAMRLRELAALTRNAVRAENERQIATSVSGGLRQALSIERAAVVELDGDQIVPLASDGVPHAPFSRTLVNAAEDAGHTVRLDDTPDIAMAVSVQLEGVQAALCAPLHTADTTRKLYLYATDRRGGFDRDAEAADLFAAAAEVATLSLDKMRRLELEAESRAAQRELEAAARIQRRMLPPSEGVIGPLRYAALLEAGRTIAGDLFTVSPLAGDGAAFCLGDVTNKGIGPGLLMAMTLSHLLATLDAGTPLARAFEALNGHVIERSSESEFVTLIAGVADGVGSITLCDAGHGHAVLMTDNEPASLEVAGGLPIAVAPGVSYEATTLTLAPGRRLVLFSDGLIEQPSAGDVSDHFEFQRVMEALRGSGSPAEDVRRLAEAVKRHAASDTLNDDLTILSITRA